MPGVSRKGDMSTQSCGASGPMPSVSASGNVFANGIPVNRVGDDWSQHAIPQQSPHVGKTSSGSGTVFVNGKPCSRIGDNISCGATIAGGSGNVIAN